MSSQVGTGEVAIVPTLKGFRRKVRSEVEGTEKESSAVMRRGFQRAGDESGTAAGRGFKRAFSSQAQGAADGVTKQMTADVAKAAREVSNARLREQDAAGNVRVAEAQLADARRKHAADSAQVIRAEERLASATRTLQATQDRTRESSEKLAQAQKKVADASGQAATETTRGWSGVRGALGSVASGVQSAMSGAMAGIKRVAADAATFVSTQFKVAGAAIAATVGVALVGGFNRLQAIEGATARMRGLGFASEDVAAAMQIANDAAVGTAFGMDELAAASAMAMTAGIKPGQQLIDYLEAIKGAATASGAPVAEIGQIFGKVRTSGRAYTMEITQLADRQIPIWQALADEIGVSTEEVRKLASEGKITAETFESAVRASTGGMAAEMNNTMGASFRNMRAALSRFGVALIGSRLEGDQVVGGLYPLFAKLFDTIKEGVNTATAAITPFMQMITDAFANKIGPVLDTAIGTFQRLTAAFKEGGGLQLPGLSNLTGMLGVLAPVIGLIIGSLGSALSGLSIFGVKIGAVFAGITGPLGLAVGALAALFLFDADQLSAGFESITSALPGMVTGIVQTLVGMISTLVPQLVETLSANVPVLLDGAVQLLLALVDAAVLVVPMLLRTVLALIPTLIEALIGMLPALVQGALTLFQGLIQGLVQIIPTLLDALFELLPGIVTALVEMLPALVAGAIQLFLGLVLGLVEAIPQLITALVALLPVLLETLVAMIPQLLITAIDVFLALVTGLLEAIPQLLIALIDMLPQVVTTLIGMLPTLIDAAVQLFTGLIAALPVIIPKLLSALVKMGPQIVDAILKIGPKLFDAGIALIQGLIDGVMSMFGAIGEAFGGVMDFIGGFFPNSPAKHGPFSGSGWTRVKRSGTAIVNQLADGFYAPDAAISTAMRGTYDAVIASAATSAVLPAVYVQNPFTGDYLLSQVDVRAEGRVQAARHKASVRLSGGEGSL